jgi:hypothetical protein
MWDAIAEEYRTRWKADPIFAGSIDVLGPAPGGESASLRVMLEGRCLAFAKPSLHPDGTPRAAHEFLAFRLGDAVGVRVPPVAFWRRPDGAQYSLSVRAFPESVTWHDAQAGLTADDRESLALDFCGGLVLHTWIDDGDHHGHGGNVVLDARAAPRQLHAAFIDHAFALSWRWSRGSKPATVVQPYYLPLGSLPQAEVAARLESVLGLSVGMIHSFVSLVPPDFLTPDRASRVIDCLDQRRTELSAAFGAVREALR